MIHTQGLNHLGLAVHDLNATRSFFTDALDWVESGRDESYPRTAVSDGNLRLTLWQVDKSQDINEFNRRKNIGLHHLAIQIGSKADLDKVYERVSRYPGVEIEFSPEPVGSGPRMHMMCYEPGGIRIEFIWNGI